MAIAFYLLAGETDQALEMAQVAFLQERIAQHRAERRGERHREAMRHVFLRQPPQHAEERKVGFGQRFKKPVFLEKIFVFRVSDEGEMSVQDKRDRGCALKR